MDNINSLLDKIPTRLRGRYISILNKKSIDLPTLVEELESLVGEIKQKTLPAINYPDLPVSEKVEDIKKLILENQVIVVAGETGSGKSTQLPKICLDLGLGKRGLIGHTQPRRLAARSIASRVAQEIGDQSKVAYKIRFSDYVNENTLVKVMTDGVLLSEIKNDKFLSQYEVIIIDEAHERSLNIDFLLGCIKNILPFRPDLKIIITSATIDHQKFISYFNEVEDITISGRTYPVEIRYQNDDEFFDFSLQERILYAIEELGRGDILVFLPTERDIHETVAYLNKQDIRFTEILPLFSRLSNKEQNKIFNPSGSMRRIILATNVAETSITVPRIKYVIDSGLARISRYSYKTKVQRLPIEKISKASANQRAGRCGRLSAGICVRLYSEEDFLSRKEFTDPEILRTNLASVILQMLFLKLGSIQDFPFIDSPDSRFVKDGFKLLFELRAISELNYSKPKITQDGIKMALMPLDPKLAKIVVEGYRQKCLKETISIASFLSVQDPRERPLNFQQKADEKHSIDKDKSSDFIAILNLANRLHADLNGLSNKERKEYFRRNFISPVRFNEWRDIHRQIIEVIHGFKWKLVSESKLNYESLHRALVSGFISNIGYNYENVEYLGARGLKFFIFPGSSQFKRKPKWLFSSEIIETSKTYARNVAKIEPEWLELLAEHLVKKHYGQPFWSKKRRSVMVNERVTLYGLEIISKRAKQYSKINIEIAREIFIREALINGEFESKVYFYQQNLKLIDQVEDLENKSRKKDILVDEQVMFEHYDGFIPNCVYDGVSFDKWLKKIPKANQQQFIFDLDTLMQHDAKNITQSSFPDVLSFGQMHLPIMYHFDPLDERDGATVTVPVAFVKDIDPIVFEWGVYGFLYNKIVALLKALPKNIRKHCVPVPKYAQMIYESVNYDMDRCKPLKSFVAKHITKIVGSVVDEIVWQSGDKIDNYLTLNINVVDENGKSIEQSRDIAFLKQMFATYQQKIDESAKEKIYYDWGFDDFELTGNVEQYGVAINVFNCLKVYEDGVKISYAATQSEANFYMKEAITQLIKLKLNTEFKKSVKNGDDLKSLSISIKLQTSSDWVIKKAIDVSFFANEQLPYNKVEFDKFYLLGLQKFETSKKLIESLNLEIINLKNQLLRKLNVKKIPLNFIQLYTDIRNELEKLFDYDFIEVPLCYLQRYRYYIQALISRLDKAKSNLHRDRSYQIEVDDLRSMLDKKNIGRHFGEISLDIIVGNFLINELWVSWYLQSVKTIESVSFKKVCKYIKDI